MKKYVLTEAGLLLSVGLLLPLATANHAVNAELTDTDSKVQTLLNEYYNKGVYTKDSVIKLSDSEKDEAAQYFHANVDTLERTTYYKGNELWMSRGNGQYSYYGSAPNNGGVTNATASEALVTPENPKVVLSGEGKESMDAYYVTLTDIKDSTGWEENDGVYTNTSAEVIDMFVNFTAPLWIGKTEENANYIDFSKATVEKVDGNLVLKLYVHSTDSAKVDNDELVFSQATISYEKVYEKHNLSVKEAWSQKDVLTIENVTESNLMYNNLPTTLVTSLSSSTNAFLKIDTGAISTDLSKYRLSFVYKIENAHDSNRLTVEYRNSETGDSLINFQIRKGALQSALSGVSLTALADGWYKLDMDAKYFLESGSETSDVRLAFRTLSGSEVPGKLYISNISLEEMDYTYIDMEAEDLSNIVTNYGHAIFSNDYENYTYGAYSRKIDSDNTTSASRIALDTGFVNLGDTISFDVTFDENCNPTMQIHHNVYGGKTTTSYMWLGSDVREYNGWKATKFVNESGKTWYHLEFLADENRMVEKLDLLYIGFSPKDGITTPLSWNIDNIKVKHSIAEPVITNSGSTISWTAIEGASEYAVYEDGVELSRVSGTSYTYVPTTGGDHALTVRAISGNESFNDSYHSNALKFNLSQIDAPVLSIEGTLVSWNAVTDAASYNVYVDGKLVTTTSETSYNVNIEAVGEHAIQVQAVSSNPSLFDSELSEEVIYEVKGTESDDLTNKLVIAKTQGDFEMGQNDVSYDGEHSILISSSAIAQQAIKLIVKDYDLAGDVMEFYVKPNSTYSDYMGIILEIFGSEDLDNATRTEIAKKIYLPFGGSPRVNEFATVTQVENGWYKVSFEFDSLLKEGTTPKALRIRLEPKVVAEYSLYIDSMIIIEN